MFPWGVELLAFASSQFSPNFGPLPVLSTSVCSITNCNNVLVSERSERKPPPERCRSLPRSEAALYTRWAHLLAIARAPSRRACLLGYLLGVLQTFLCTPLP